MTQHRLKQSEIAAYRVATLAGQGNKCALCGETVPQAEAVLDHCHKSGVIRGTLHRGCNAMLGHIENNAPRHKLSDRVRLHKMLSGVVKYTQKFAGTAALTRPLHPTYKTEDEKRLARNAKARKTRAKKEQA